MLLYSDYLRAKYGCKVYRIAVDAGFTCPNRDGTKGKGGCLYCNENGSRAAYIEPSNTVRKQLETRIDYLKANKGGKKFIAYFQPFSNTYAPIDILKKNYDQITPFDDIVGLSIGTRPDTVDEEKLSLIASYREKHEVWIEYGLQTMHNRTLKAINRGHTFGDFIRAVELAKNRHIPVCAHVILGLPGETREEMLETAKKIRQMGIEGVKIHVLHVLKGSALEDLYNSGKVRLLGEDEYVDLVCAFLRCLPEDIIVQRLTGQGSREDHIAPEWAFNKNGTIRKIMTKITNHQFPSTKQ